MSFVVSDFLAISPFSESIAVGKKRVIPVEGTCSVCSKERLGYPKSAVLSKSAAGLEDLMSAASDLICCHCADTWQQTKRNGRALLATKEDILFPTITLDKKSDRPMWRDVFRAFPKQERICILTTDPKRRIWPLARVSAGDTLSLLLNDPSRGLFGNRNVSITQLVEILDLIEEIYSAGFSKQAIENSLISGSKSVNCSITLIVEWEGQLSKIRTQPEFIPALIIAQKNEQNTHKTNQSKPIDSSVGKRKRQRAEQLTLI